MDEGLFEMKPIRPVDAEPDKSLSADQRRTLRRRTRLEHGLHPVYPFGLHPDAPRVTTPFEPGDGPRCGSCAHVNFDRYHERRYLKCEVIGVTNGANTDMRRWWPACLVWVEAKP